MAEILQKLSQLADPSPMMQQYIDIKREHPDYILLYRLGDFYEMFFEDAVAVSRDLELTLTGRDCGEGKRAAMCGVPFHKLELYLGRLVEKGYKVAICEQTEDPALAKGLVKRSVCRMVTPGTVTDASILTENCNNYLCAVSLSAKPCALAFADISTGQLYASLAETEEDFQRELGSFSPREVLFDLPCEECRSLCDFVALRLGAMVTPAREDLFADAFSSGVVRQTFSDRLTDLAEPSVLRALTALFAYIRQTQMVEPTFLRELHIRRGGQHVELDLSTLRNLELTGSMRTGERRGTLLWVLDATVTSMGARRLRTAICQPLCDVGQIRYRQKAVEELVGSFLLRQEIRAALDPILDIERLTAKAVYGTANARDLRALAQSLATLPSIRTLLEGAKSPALCTLFEEMDPLQELCDLLLSALTDEPPFTVREGGMIRDGYHSDVDYLRQIQASGTGWKEEIEQREQAETGIKNLKVGYNKVFGYYIEVTRSQLDLVPPHYVRKQTLTGCERFITDELKQMENTVLGAADKLAALEYELFVGLRERVAEQSARLQKTASQIATLDMYQSLATVAAEGNYVCPEVDNSSVISIVGGRHPVVERCAPDSFFVPNDTYLDTDASRMMLITGPNMAGKSTYMRQVALIVLMAQLGSFVPAKEARIGVVDRIFTRVGASDDLASGQSTFMLEMTEVAHILKHATERSLVIYDEVGRGTSTYDGMSIARAVVEYTASRKLGARAMFATHYHELTELEGICEGVVNYHIAAKKRGDGIVFLRKIVKGATDDSYGIEVAKLAGVPAEVVRRAREVLADIEQGEGIRTKTRPVRAAEPASFDMLTALAKTEADEVADALREADLNTLTPIEAMNLLFTLKKKLTVQSN